MEEMQPPAEATQAEPSAESLGTHKVSVCSEDEDAITLASLGYTPRLKRYFGRATSAVCGVTMLTPLCGGISGLVTALSYGGPAIAVWGWCVGAAEQLLHALGAPRVATARAAVAAVACSSLT
jgi:hypothetical protein